MKISLKYTHTLRHKLNLCIDYSVDPNGQVFKCFKPLDTGEYLVALVFVNFKGEIGYSRVKILVVKSVYPLSVISDRVLAARNNIYGE